MMVGSELEHAILLVNYFIGINKVFLFEQSSLKNIDDNSHFAASVLDLSFPHTRRKSQFDAAHVVVVVASLSLSLSFSLSLSHTHKLSLSIYQSTYVSIFISIKQYILL